MAKTCWPGAAVIVAGLVHDFKDVAFRILLCGREWRLRDE